MIGSTYHTMKKANNVRDKTSYPRNDTQDCFKYISQSQDNQTNYADYHFTYKSAKAETYDNG